MIIFGRGTILIPCGTPYALQTGHAGTEGWVMQPLMRFIAVCVFVAVSVGLASCEQPSSEPVADRSDVLTASMIAAAAGHALNELTAAHPYVLLDAGPRFDPTYRVGSSGGEGTHAPAVVDHVARVLNAEVALRDEVVHCGESEGEQRVCGMENGGVVIRVIESSGNGTEGRVVVHLTYEWPEGEGHVHALWKELLLERRGSEWTVVGVGMQGAT